jgi:clan AA aspartic protease
MGQIKERVIIKNFGDFLKVKEGTLPEDKVRSVEIEAIVDTGAAYLCLPSDIIEKLGLIFTEVKNVITANGRIERKIYSVASIAINEREIRMDVMENDMTTPPLIGYLVLEAMDYVVDPKNQKIIGNPEHDGKWVVDLF